MRLDAALGHYISTVADQRWLSMVSFFVADIPFVSIDVAGTPECSGAARVRESTKSAVAPSAGHTPARGA